VFLKFWGKKVLEKRAHQRIRTHLLFKLRNGNSHDNALVTNLSENGMCFITGADVYAGLITEASIHLDKNDFNVPLVICRIERNGALYNNFGAVLINPPKEYLEFIDSLKNT
jgi:hypothetical protein